jgi:hypothetical protein
VSPVERSPSRAQLSSSFSRPELVSHKLTVAVLVAAIFMDDFEAVESRTAWKVSPVQDGALGEATRWLGDEANDATTIFAGC